MIQISIPYISDANVSAVAAAMRGGSVSTYGSEVSDLESALAEWTGVPNVVAVNSGTSAIELLCKLMFDDVAKKKLVQTVAVSDFTFIASTNAAINSGLSVCPIYCGQNDYSMCPKALEEEVFARRNSEQDVIAAVIYTLPAGNIGSSLTEVQRLCERHEIPLIIDGASSIAVDFDSLRLTSKATQAVVISFNGNKVITSGAGGAILTPSKELAERCRAHISLYRNSKYEHYGAGENKKMPALAAALGLSQLQEIEWRVEKRRQLFNLYHDFLASSPLSHDFGFFGDLSSRCSYWIAGYVPHDKTSTAQSARLREALGLVGIASPPFWRAIAAQGDYQKYISAPWVQHDPLYPDFVQLPSHFLVDEGTVLKKLADLEVKL